MRRTEEERIVKGVELEEEWKIDRWEGIERRIGKKRRWERRGEEEEGIEDRSEEKDRKGEE